jgi:2-C-methyl-D-erythritol 2,4-cyclodiphosphate synthase
MAEVDRVGLGCDLHRLAAGRRLVLAGVVIDWPEGLVGHSDADVALHALIDAVLGAAGLGDIGEAFPDTDPTYKDADSGELTRQAAGMAARAGWRVVNADVTIRAERPKLSGYKQAMRERIAELLGVGRGQVNVKAKTDEGTGPVGSGEAMAALAIVGLAKLRP